MNRQQLRKLLLLIALLLFPITMWYFSPVIILNGMLQHILNGSFFVFLSMLVLSTFMGRIFCSYLCPAGGLQECTSSINPKPAKQGKRKMIKFFIWSIWLIGIILSFIFGSGKVHINFFYMTVCGVSIAKLEHYIIYYGVILILFLPSVIHGKRAACHYICWMAPFMIIGEKIGQKLHIPQLHITAKSSDCISCKKCNSVCPMGLNVSEMVKKQNGLQSADCIQCGACIDNCPKKVISYSWKPKN